MAKESMKAREVKRAKLTKKYAAKREALKQIINTGSPEEADITLGTTGELATVVHTNGVRVQRQ